MQKRERHHERAARVHCSIATITTTRLQPAGIFVRPLAEALRQLALLARDRESHAETSLERGLHADTRLCPARNDHGLIRLLRLESGHPIEPNPIGMTMPWVRFRYRGAVFSIWSRWGQAA